MLALYLNWYGTALVAFLVTIWFTRRWRAYWRIIAITGVFALGFTTVPLFSEDGGAWYPMGAYYLSSSRVWIEAAGAATMVIGFVWALLALSSFVVWLVLRTARSILHRPER